MYQELSAKVYDKEALTIRVLPAYIVGSWLSIYHSRGRTWHLKDFDDPRARGFANLPHHKLSKIKIEIFATEPIPGIRDRGQILCLYYKIRDVGNMLMAARKSGLHDIELHFLDSRRSKWIDEEGYLRTTIRRIRNAPLFHPETDYDAICLALCPLGRFHEATVLKHGYAAALHRWLKGGMKWGKDISREEETEEQKVGEEEAVIRIIKRMEMLYAHYDLALDGETGQTANMLRLHRFATWYPRGLVHGSDYLRELETMWKDPVWEDEWIENNSIPL